MPRFCSVIGCSAQEKRDGVVLFQFPAAMRSRAAWIKFCGREENWEPAQIDRICQRHFLDEKPTTNNPDPTLYPATPVLATPHRKILVGGKKSKLVTQFCYDKADGEPSGIESVPAIIRKRPKETAISDDASKKAIENLLTAPILADFRSPPRKKTVKASLFSRTASQDHCYNAKVTAASQSSFSYSSAGSGNEIGNVDSPTKPSKMVTSFIMGMRRRTLSGLSKEQLKVTATKYIRKWKTMERKTSRLFYFKWANLANDDKKTQFYTFFHSYAVLEAVYLDLKDEANSLKTTVKKSQSKGRRRRLEREDEFLLTLIKLRLNLPLVMLGDMFGVSFQYAGKIVQLWMRFLADKLGQFVFWVPHTHRSPPPPSFAKYPNCVAIIDCFEIKTEKPKNRRNARQGWSEYKHHQTAKVLIAVSPNSTIIHLSPPWGGRVSDQQIVKDDTQFLALLDSEPSGTVVLADKGFTDLTGFFAFRHIRLITPPKLIKAKQLTRKAVEETCEKANVRIHVERVIGQLRCFRILQNVYLVSKFYCLEDVLVICGGIVNLRPPIVKK